MELDVVFESVANFMSNCVLIQSLALGSVVYTWNWTYFLNRTGGS
jgi:hypothetical protein